MSTKRKPSTETKGAEKILNLRVPADLDAKAQDIAEKVKLSKSDAIRLAMDRGLDVLLQQLTSAA